MFRSVFSLIVVAGVAWTPVRAHACSWLASPIQSSLPGSGASDVPLDVAPIIRGYWKRDSLVWETLDGRGVEFDLQSGPSANFTSGSTGELKPRRALEPNTIYVIRAESTAGEPPQRIEFTTGSRLTEGRELSAPALDASFLIRAGNGCAPGNVRSCVRTGEDILIEVVDAKDTTLTRDVVSGSVTLWPIEQPHCIRAFRRDAAGRLSRATERCGPELPSRVAMERERSLSCDDDGPASRGDGGVDEQTVEDQRFFCSATPGHSYRDRGSLLGTLGLIGLWFVRRSMRRA